MIFLSQRFCNDCNKETVHHNHKCVVCYVREDRERTRVWDALDVDTRLANLRERVEQLEARPPQC